MKTLILIVLLAATALHGQDYEGLWQGYDGEWGHVSRQLIALAEATPAEKFAWRPAPNVRSTSEVYMHIAIANFFLLPTGQKRPDDLKEDLEKKVTAKADVINWLKRSLDAVKTAHLAVKHGRSHSQGQGKQSRCHSGWYVPAHHCARQRTHGPIGGVRAHDRHRPALGERIRAA